MTALLDAAKRHWHMKTRQQVADIANQLAWSTEPCIDLCEQVLTPTIGLLSTTDPLRTLETAIPLLCKKIVQWYIDIEVSNTNTVFVKLGTGGRINHCQATLSLLQLSTQTNVATAQIDGKIVQDNQWTAFHLSQAVSAGRYLAQLQSPDADNVVNTLFLWLAPRGIAHYCYVSPPLALLQNQLQQFNTFPVISILLLVENPEYLYECLQSVITQVYPHWELCIIAKVPNDFLENCQHQHINKIKLQYHTLLSYNKALEMATGSYIALLPEDGLLTKDCLLEFAKKIVESPILCDMLYSDEDKISGEGICYDAYFKPDWSVDLLKGWLYTGQLGIYRTDLLQKIGGFREKFAEQQIWDMVLRLTEKAQTIHHLPQILYHNRREKRFLAKSYPFVQESLDREGRKGYVTSQVNTATLHYSLSTQPLISIVVPTKDLATVFARCINSICNITSYSNWEIIVVDNGSQAEETLRLFEEFKNKLNNKFNVIRHDIPFNFAKLVNLGVQAARGEIILLLNNDTEVLTPPEWLQEMAGFAQHPEIGCVSSKLLYPSNDSIQHAGIICGIGGIANHGHRYFSRGSEGYFHRLAVVANYSAVTGACLMVKRTLWEKINGFDENLAIAFNDVDFCLKLLAMGYRHVVLPQVILYHNESKSRGLENTQAKQQRLQQEQIYMEQRWGERLHHDPYYNQHLTKRVENFTLDPDSIYHCSE